MTLNGWLQIAIFAALSLATIKPLGIYMARVFAGERTFLSPVLRPVERGLYALCGVDPSRRTSIGRPTPSPCCSSDAAALFLLYALQRLQDVLPFNPAGHGGGSAGARLQHGGELHHQHQLAGLRRREHDELPEPDAGLTIHNFVSAATGIALAVALIPRLRAALGSGIGNFWADLTRCTLYVLLPMCVVIALVLVAQGVPQNLPPTPRRRPWKAPSR
jgi:K+-transporting ATPase ATPase A chain